jgi:hypothetical protein
MVRSRGRRVFGLLLVVEFALLLAGSSSGSTWRLPWRSASDAKGDAPLSLALSEFQTRWGLTK